MPASLSWERRRPHRSWLGWASYLARKGRGLLSAPEDGSLVREEEEGQACASSRVEKQLLPHQPSHHVTFIYRECQVSSGKVHCWP